MKRNWLVSIDMPRLLYEMVVLVGTLGVLYVWAWADHAVAPLRRRPRHKP